MLGVQSSDHVFSHCKAAKTWVSIACLVLIRFYKYDLVAFKKKSIIYLKSVKDKNMVKICLNSCLLEG